MPLLEQWQLKFCATGQASNHPACLFWHLLYHSFLHQKCNTRMYTSFYFLIYWNMILLPVLKRWTLSSLIQKYSEVSIFV
jgi:hypothetical protein